MKRRQLLQALALAPLLGPRLARSTGVPGTIAASFGTQPSPQSTQRVFAAGAPAAVLTYVLAPKKLLGWPQRLSEAARRMLAEVPADLPHLGRLAGRGSTVTAESLLALEPDLVLDAGSVNPTYLSAAERVWQQTRLPYVLIDGSLADHPTQLRDVGRLLGVPERGEMLAREVERVFDLSRAVLAQVAQADRPRVYYGRGPDGLETGLGGSINMEVIGFAGGRNVAARAGRGGITRVSMEQVLAWDPEVVVTQEPRFIERVLHDPLWRSVTAVRHGRVHLAPVLPFGWLDGPPSVNRVIGVQWVLAVLYPGRHPGLTPSRVRKATTDFYRRFYGSRAPTGLLDGLLNRPMDAAG